MIFVDRVGHALNIDEVHLLSCWPIVLVLEVYLLLDDPGLHADVRNVFVDFFVGFAVARGAAALYPKGDTACPHHAFRAIELQLLAFAVDDFGTHDHVARPRLE